MDVAVRGDRASCLTVQLAPHSWFFAVARGFGQIDGVAIERVLLGRLRSEFARRSRGERFRRALDRPHAAATAIMAALVRVNADLYARTASHDDYVTAAASFTGVLIVRERAYAFHAGGTAAYLAHGGEIAELSHHDAFDDGAVPLLPRGFGSARALEVAVANVELAPGDTIVLVGHRLRGEVDRRALIAHVESADPGEHVVVARFEFDDANAEVLDGERLRRPWAAIAARCVAAIAFLLALVWTS